MARFLQRPDLEAADLAGAVAALGYVTGTALPTILQAQLPDALTATLPQVLDYADLQTNAKTDFTSAINELNRGMPEISFRRMGLVPGVDIGPALNNMIALFPGGITFIVDPVPATQTDGSDSWLINTTVEIKDNVMFRGGGPRSSCQMMRTNTGLMFRVAGAAAGQGSTLIISGWAMRGVVLHGGGRGFDLIEALNGVGFFWFDTSIKGVASGGRLFYIKGQVQDSCFRDCFFGGGGKIDGTRAAWEIDDGLSVGGHIQNIIFDNCVWETYYGTALRIYGTSDQGLSPSLIQLLSCKLESTQSNALPDIVVSNGARLTFDFRQIVSKSNLATPNKPCIIQLDNCSTARITGLLSHQRTGAGSSSGYLDRLIACNAASSNITVDIDLDNTTANACQAADNALVSFGTTVGNTVKITNPGTKLPANVQTNEVTYRLVDRKVANAVIESWSRLNSTGVLQNTSSLIALVNTNGTKYVGRNTRNNWAGGSSTDLAPVSGAFAGWELDNTTGEVGTLYGVRFGTRTGMTATYGAGAPATTEAAGSYYGRTDATAAQPSFYTRVGTAWTMPNALYGTTANRPPEALIGWSYFDTTLGKPVWCKTAATTTPVAAAVWVDATGATV